MANHPHQANERFQVRSSPTPLPIDLLFYQIHDGKAPKNYEFNYGDKHPDTEHFPHHFLVYVSEADAEGFRKWYYVARRENQDLYNYESAQADIGGTKFNVVTRYYVNLRKEEFKWNVPFMGTLMPDIPAGVFPAANFVLGESSQVKITEPYLESLFTTEKRVYIDRAPITTQEMDDELGIAVSRTVNLYYRGEAIPGVPGGVWGTATPPSGLTSPGGPTNEVDQISDNWWAVTTMASIKGTLDAYLYSYPVRVDLGDLPRELLAVNVLWNQNVSIGTQDYAFLYTWVGNSGKTEKSAADEGSSSASIQPEVQLKFRDIASSNLLGTRKEFFMANPVTEAKILSRLKATRWPVFHPESTTLTASGQSVGVNVHVNISLVGTWNSQGIQTQGWDRGTSDSFSTGLSFSSVQTPACIHGIIPIANAGPVVIPVSATAYMNMTHSVLGSIAASHTKVGSATGLVSPTSIPAVKGPTTIPTSGIYLMDAVVHPYKLGYSRVSAILFDASKLK